MDLIIRIACDPTAIHQVTTANMECLDDLAPEVFDTAIELVQIACFLGGPRHVMLVAIEDGMVVGSALVVGCSE